MLFSFSLLAGIYLESDELDELQKTNKQPYERVINNLALIPLQYTFPSKHLVCVYCQHLPLSFALPSLPPPPFNKQINVKFAH